jgi:hypothetical protein
MPGSLARCGMVELRGVSDQRGQLVFIEGMKDIPFEIKRIYYMFDVPDMSSRAGHAHKTLRQLFIAMSGRFDVRLDDGFDTRLYTLDDPRRGLCVNPVTWREVLNFSPGAVCMVLASDCYDESDYYRDYGQFLHAVRGENQ